MALLSRRTWDEWIAEYGRSHQHPKNRACHAIGIPTIVLSLVLFALSPFVDGLWIVAAASFVVGWVLQFVGHAYEGKPPEFLKDPRFLLVGFRWWLAKMRGRA